MNSETIKKYNVPVPRYTSYPPANYFEPFSGTYYQEAIEKSNQVSGNSHISFYLHIPFCHHLCYYCGCNSYPMMNAGMIEKYVSAMHQEIDLLIPLLNPQRLISQIHYGGGSPTAIPPHFIKELNEHLLSAFRTIESPEIAIECHPGYLSHQDWQELAACGFNRFSIGVQDLNKRVLETVNRRPPLIPLNEIFFLLRNEGASINLDFLYGLPEQTAASFLHTIESAIDLAPDRLVTFSYAHVPWIHKRQLILEKTGLPESEEKSRMFSEAAVALHRAGYRSVGLDHFVLPEDELNIALETRQLHRNFQGYCTRRTTGQVYAVGVTGISQLDTAYAQNGKDIRAYIDAMEHGMWYICKGYSLNRQEQIVREVIENLMCNYYIDWRQLSEYLSLSIEEVKSATAYDENKLKVFSQDGLIDFSTDYLAVTSTGSPFVRNVAASLDPLMLHPVHSFSKPV
ncbi:oxygen-independent coproporphyrinogen III oxidase [Bacteroides helcogenes]|uniref:Coproporphyrinogen-III oxidase n=1 Tax=Bacteroides helcogenes (strain ATCC 35417 / DSM 20613 / JCM 6297 / CCUG 15421 / P 36-108) TaxID=693979 RepID=E6SN60_BACT6|nr:oxygen-independent coproporphyrinogen III oxidase [Bacteroides helcogenes]ADV44713.1 coproporphyrinogen III oxidase, anaerobic [Bacteroides helcogenes P 36-108]MDY5238526.1 oxygen-independent coproporphyrinogen III oxidase [Bacteroides helcogenes]